MEPETHTDTSFDFSFRDRQLQMMEAAIPYAGGQSQRLLVLLVKSMELARTIVSFREPEPSIQMCSADADKEAVSIKLLGDLREFCTKEEQDVIDKLLIYMQMLSSGGTPFQ